MQRKENWKGRFHASITIEDETTKKNALEENETQREYYLVSTLLGSIITN